MKRGRPRQIALFAAIGSIAIAACGDGGASEENDAAVPDAAIPADAGATPDSPAADAGSDAGVDTGPVCTDLDGGTPIPLETDPVFVKGPYLMYTSQTSVVVMWETPEAAGSTVEYGPTEALGSSVAGTEKGPEAGDEGTVHELSVTGLLPGAEYFYRAGDATAWSAVHRFRTAAPQATPFRFAALADTQSHPEVHSRLIPLIAAWGPSFVVHAGDEIGDGSSAAGWQTEFFDVIRPLAHRIPYFVAVGNHEKDHDLFYRFVSYPTEQESYYTFTWGDVFFVAIDSNKYIFGTLDPQHAWIDEQLKTPEAKAAKWRVAAFHEPAYSESWGGCTFEGNPAIRSALIPLLEQSGINLIINGHTHEYERGYLNGVYHVITGGGGGGLETDWCTDWPHITVQKPVHHFLAVEAGCEALTVRAIDIDGIEFDFFEIPAQGQKDPKD
ncbi:MAG: metallophosphoesterase family protein [Deltaproteobacteria bacterium]|nr:metallophosphoesterase family protein [Deltaproteobacteria bacterium]